MIGKMDCLMAPSSVLGSYPGFGFSTGEGVIFLFTGQRPDQQPAFSRKLPQLNCLPGCKLDSTREPDQDS
jgi:hypothetical protein